VAGNPGAGAIGTIGGATTLGGVTITAAVPTFVSETANAIAANERTDLKLVFILNLSLRATAGIVV